MINLAAVKPIHYTYNAHDMLFLYMLFFIIGLW